MPGTSLTCLKEVEQRSVPGTVYEVLALDKQQCEVCVVTLGVCPLLPLFDCFVYKPLRQTHKTENLASSLVPSPASEMGHVTL